MVASSLKDGVVVVHVYGHVIGTWWMDMGITHEDRHGDGHGDSHMGRHAADVL